MKASQEIKIARSRAERLAGDGEEAFRRDRYLLVFFLILLTVLCTAFVGEGPWGLIITLLLQTATLLVALRTSDAGRKSQIAAAVVAALTVAGVTIALFTGGEQLAHLAYAASMVVLVAVTPIAIVRRLLSHPTVNFTTVTGAANIYLLFGLFWATLYSFIGALTRQGSQTPAQSFFITVSRRVPVASDFIYYSYTTLTTVGYGDLTASSQIGRMVSITEALVGQLYLVIVVSVLVANMGRVRSRPADAAENAAPEAGDDTSPTE